MNMVENLRKVNREQPLIIGNDYNTTFLVLKWLR